MNRSLLNFERQLLAPYIDVSGKAQLEVMAARRRALEEDVQRLPGNDEQVEVATSEIRTNYGDVERRAFRQMYQAASMRAQVAAVEIWLAGNRATLKANELELMSSRLVALRNDIADLEGSLDELQADIRAARAISGGDGGRIRAQRLREAYAAVMTRESELLKSMRSRLPSEFASLASRLDAKRATLEQAGQQLSKIQRTLDEQIEDRVAEIRAQLTEELKRLDEYEVASKGLDSDTDAILGPLAAESLKSVAQEFKNLVRKADVGIIDVAWARKQSETGKVNDLVKKQQSQVQELEGEFADVLDDE